MRVWFWNFFPTRQHPADATMPIVKRSDETSPPHKRFFLLWPVWWRFLCEISIRGRATPTTADELPCSTIAPLCSRCSYSVFWFRRIRLTVANHPSMLVLFDRFSSFIKLSARYLQAVGASARQRVCFGSFCGIYNLEYVVRGNFWKCVANCM